MEDDLKQKPFCSVTGNAVERDQINAAVKLVKLPRARWINQTLVKEARRILSRTTAKKGGAK